MLVRWDHDERPIYRAAGVEHDQPWWFASRDPDLPGRFDLPAPDGTCYCADDPVGALLERHIDPDALDPIVDVADLATSAVWTCVPPTEFDAADLTSRAAPVTKELSTVTPYDVEGGPGEWADASPPTDGTGWLPGHGSTRPGRGRSRCSPMPVLAHPTGGVTPRDGTRGQLGR